MLSSVWCADILHTTKALKVPRHLSTHRQITGIKSLNLFDRGSGILGEVEDVDLALAL